MKLFKEKKVLILSILLVIFALLAGGLGWMIINTKNDFKDLVKDYNSLDKTNNELKARYDVVEKELTSLKDEEDAQDEPDSTNLKTEIKLPAMSKNYSTYIWRAKDNTEEITLTLYGDNQATYTDEVGSYENGKITGGIGMWRGIYSTVGNKIIFIGAQGYDDTKEAAYTLKFDSTFSPANDIISFTKVNDKTITSDLDNKTFTKK